jgi:hypothetical protein
VSLGDLIFTYFPFVVCLVVIVISVYELIANRRWRRWRDQMHAAQLAEVADRADTLAIEGVPRPGTTAVFRVRPDFDFTLGGHREDDRRFEDFRQPYIVEAQPQPDES